MLGKLTKDYEAIAERVRAGKLPLVARVPAIERAVDEYALARAEFYEKKRDSGVKIPLEYRHDGRILEQYADLILYEELTWSHPDKMSIVERPIMSHWQKELRQEKYRATEDIQFGDRRYNGRRKTYSFGEDGEVVVSNPKMTNKIDESTKQADGLFDVNALIDRARLTEKQRQVIEYIFYDDLTQEAAAERLDISQQAVKKHLDAALRKLREVATIADLY